MPDLRFLCVIPLSLAIGACHNSSTLPRRTLFPKAVQEAQGAGERADETPSADADTQVPGSADEADSDTLSIRFDPTVSYGRVTGFLKIPKGGRPGSTSRNRPRMGEVGIEDATFYDVPLQVDWDSHRVTLGQRIVHMDGSRRLDEDLISNNSTFAAGTTADATLQLDWTWLGYQHVFATEFAGGQLDLAPGLSFINFDFFYELDGSDGTQVRRTFRVGGAAFRSDVEWTSGDWTIGGQLVASAPVEDFAQLYSGRLQLRRRLWSCDLLAADALIGTGYDRHVYIDHQLEPNEIDIGVGPYLTFGLQLTF